MGYVKSVMERLQAEYEKSDYYKMSEQEKKEHNSKLMKKKMNEFEEELRSFSIKWSNEIEWNFNPKVKDIHSHPLP